MTEKKKTGPKLKYGEPTIAKRIPVSIEPEIDRLIAELKADQEARAAQTNEEKMSETPTLRTLL